MSEVYVGHMRKCASEYADNAFGLVKEKGRCGVQCEMIRSNQFYIMMSLLNEGAIAMKDLDDCSDELAPIVPERDVNSKCRKYF